MSGGQAGSNSKSGGQTGHLIQGRSNKVLQRKKYPLPNEWCNIPLLEKKFLERHKIVTRFVGEKKQVKPPDQGSPFLKRVILIGLRVRVLCSFPEFGATFSFLIVSLWLLSALEPFSSSFITIFD